MRQIVGAIFRALFGRANSKPISAEEFTQECARAFSEAGAGLQVAIVRDLELRITAENGQQSTSYLDNLYGTCSQHPKLRREAIARYVAGCLEPLSRGPGVDRTCIVPVIKDRGWLTEVRQGLAERGAKEIPEPVYEEFGGELLIVYAVDSENSIAFLPPAAMEEANISRGELRLLAASNLKRLLPKIERAGDNGLYMFTVGGTYEASLLLLDTIWAGMQAEVQGEVVVSVPTRDVLLVTGSENAAGMSKVREIAEAAWKAGPYRLTPQLLVYRDGKFQMLA
ncbi:MAG: DUF1444 family protein [Candidatus Hydrogenedentales bacterium]|jgi:uncharacterized protein YtpQ (UPF0354 family)